MADISFSGQAGWLPRRALAHRDALVVTLHRAGNANDGFVHESSIRWQSDPPRLVSLPSHDHEAVVPSGMIFHMTRCGSTLAARVLAAIDGVTVVSEPSLVGRLLGSPAATSRTLAQLLALYAWGTGRSGGPLIVKWHTLVNQRMDLVRTLFPDVPCVFVVRDPVEVLVSCVRWPMPLLDRLSDDLLAPHLRVGDVSRLELAERAARYVASQCFWAARQDSLRVVEYSTLPAVAMEVLPAFLGCVPVAGDRARMEEQLVLDAKNPRRAFTPDAPAKQLAADGALRELAERIIRPELDAVLSRHARLETTTRST